MRLQTSHGSHMMNGARHMVSRHRPLVQDFLEIFPFRRYDLLQSARTTIPSSEQSEENQ